MKIGVACEGNKVAGHFGHCEGFNIFTTEDGKITSSQFVQNPGHKPGFLPNFLNDLGIKVIIAGGMGAGAVTIFEEKGIQIITGATGEAEKSVKRFLEGSLESNGSICREHQHQDSCGGHH